MRIFLWGNDTICSSLWQSRSSNIFVSRYYGDTGCKYIVLRKKSKEIFLPILLCVGPSCLAPSCVLRGISGRHKFNATNKFVCVAKVWFTKVCMFVVALRSGFTQKYPVLVTLAMSNLSSSAFLSSLSPPRRRISSRTRTYDTGGRVLPLPSGGRKSWPKIITTAFSFARKDYRASHSHTLLHTSVTRP